MIVLVAPVPLAVTPVPTKLNVLADVAKDEPSSCTVIALASTVIVLVAPVPDAVTPSPTKFNVVADFSIGQFQNFVVVCRDQGLFILEIRYFYIYRSY